MRSLFEALLVHARTLTLHLRASFLPQVPPPPTFSLTGSCHYYLQAPRRSASGEHADTQRNCKPWHEIKKKRLHSVGKRPLLRDYPRPRGLLAPRHPRRADALLIFSDGLARRRWENVARAHSLNDRGPRVVPTNHFRQRRKCY